MGNINLIFIIVIILILIIALIVYFVKIFLVPQKLHSIEKDIDDGRYDAAIRALKQIINKNNMDFAAHRLLALAYEKTGNLQMAVVEYRFALRNARNEPLRNERQMRSSLGNILFKLKNFDDALNEFLLLTKIDSQNSDVYFKIGKLCYQLGKIDNALRYMQLAIKYDPNNSEAQYLLGIVQYETQNYKEALMSFLNNLKLNPKNWEAHFYMGRIYKTMKDYSRAMESYEVSTHDEKVKAKALLEKGLCFLEIGNYKKATEDFERGLKSSAIPSDNVTLNTRYFLAKAYEDMRDYTLAIEQWEKIESAKPGFKDVDQKLANYADLRQDDHLKDFMTASPQEFQNICYAILIGNGFKVNDIQISQNALVSAVAVDSSTAKWRSAKSMSTLIKFRRDNDTLDTDEMRVMVDEMKQANSQRGMYIHIGKFSRNAKSFAETRPIDLYTSDKLKTLLQNAYDEEGKLKTDEDMRTMQQ